MYLLSEYMNVCAFVRICTQCTRMYCIVIFAMHIQENIGRVAAVA